MTQFHLRPFSELSTKQLFDILKLRQDVFVLEQQCLYPDIDALDQQALHLFAYDGALDELIAYARVLAPGNKYPDDVAIGRVVTSQSKRGHGLGRLLMQEAVSHARAQFPDCCTIKISAQEHLEAFYRSMGFSTSSEPYDDDGIMHIDMRLDG